MRVSVSRVVILGASNLDLLEAPLGQVDVASPKIATQDLVLEAEPRSERPDVAEVPGGGVVNDLDLPVIFVVANSQVSIAGHLLVSLGHGGSNLVGVEVATCLSVDQADSVFIADESRVGLNIQINLPAIRVEKPLVVGILVVITSNLLLARAFGVPGELVRPGPAGKSGKVLTSERGYHRS